MGSFNSKTGNFNYLEESGKNIFGLQDSPKEPNFNQSIEGQSRKASDPVSFSYIPNNKENFLEI